MMPIPYEDRLRQDGAWALREVSSFLHGDDRLFNAVQRVCKILDGIGCHYALTDGIAMVLHGSCRVTSRIEFLVEGSKRELVNRTLSSLNHIEADTVAGQFIDFEFGIPVSVLSSVQFPSLEEVTTTRFGFRVLRLKSLIEWKLIKAHARSCGIRHSSGVQEICRDLHLRAKFATRLSPDVRQDFLALCEPLSAEMIEL